MFIINREINYLEYKLGTENRSHAQEGQFWEYFHTADFILSALHVDYIITESFIFWLFLHQKYY